MFFLFIFICILVKNSNLDINILGDKNEPSLKILELSATQNVCNVNIECELPLKFSCVQVRGNQSLNLLVALGYFSFLVRSDMFLTMIVTMGFCRYPHKR